MAGLYCGHFGWPSVPKETEAWVRKLADKLRVEKDVKVFNNLLTSVVADKMEEQDN